AGAEMRSLVIQSIFQNGNPESGGEAATEQPQMRPLSGREMSGARIQPLLELIGLEQDRSVYQVLVELLGCYQDSSVYNGSNHPEITQAIIGRLKAETDPERRADLVSALRSTRSGDARDAILEALNGTSDSRVIRSGLVALSAKEENAA